MSYIYCKECDWSQDDFWEQGGYTPFSAVDDYLEECLFRKQITFDDYFFKDHPDLIPDGRDSYGLPYVDGLKYVAWDLRRRAKRIENMKFRTWLEWDARGEKKWDCPVCGGKQSLGVD